MVGTSLSQFSNSPDAVEAVSSIQSSNSDAIEAQRKHRRVDIRQKIVIQPCNSIDRQGQKWIGECHDISRGGCRVLAQVPLQIGSVYWIQFEPTANPIDPVFARCVRGHLLRENAFEFGMSFLTPIELPNADSKPAPDSSLI